MIATPSLQMNTSLVTMFATANIVTDMSFLYEIFLYTLLMDSLWGSITSAFGNATLSVSDNQLYLVK